MAPSNHRIVAQHRRHTQPATSPNGSDVSSEDIPEFVPNVEHQELLNDTNSNKRDPKTVQDYNSRLNRLIIWIRTNYPDKVSLFIRPITDEEMQNSCEYYKTTEDLIYNKLNIDMVKTFISSQKVKTTNADGSITYCSYENLRKYSDAVKFGASRCKTLLIEGYHAEMKSFWNQVKKRIKNTKRKETCHFSWKLSNGVLQGHF